MKQLDSILTSKDNYGSSFISPPKGSDFSELERYKSIRERLVNSLFFHENNSEKRVELD